MFIKNLLLVDDMLFETRPVSTAFIYETQARAAPPLEARRRTGCGLKDSRSFGRRRSTRRRG